MTSKKILILSAPKHSGKTTRLLQWSTGRDDVFGILTPIVDGERMFMDIHTKATFLMEAYPDEINILEVGKYRFSKASFNKASAILLAALQHKRGFIVADEIGPLELRGSGFSETLFALLEATTEMQIVLVVREELLQQVTDYFDLDRFGVAPLPF